jgi:hypothetical protein
MYMIARKNATPSIILQEEEIWIQTDELERLDCSHCTKQVFEVFQAVSKVGKPYPFQ